MMGFFYLGEAVEAAVLVYLWLSALEQRIGKRNYLGPGAWEAAVASTRGRGVVSL